MIFDGQCWLSTFLLKMKLECYKYYKPLEYYKNKCLLGLFYLTRCWRTILALINRSHNFLLLCFNLTSIKWDKYFLLYEWKKKKQIMLAQGKQEYQEFLKLLYSTKRWYLTWFSSTLTSKNLLLVLKVGMLSFSWFVTKTNEADKILLLFIKNVTKCGIKKA